MAYDHLNEWPEHHPYDSDWLLSHFPRGAQLGGIESFGERIGPPLKVTVRQPGVDESVVVLRWSRLITGVEREAAVLPLLSDLGLPVPSLLSDIHYCDKQPRRGAVGLLSFLPGIDLQTFAEDHDASKSEELLLKAVERLHGLTPAIASDPRGDHLPRRDLLAELTMIAERGGPWLDQTLVREAIQALIPVLSEIHAPLVFSNGDYNPANFLTDGTDVTAFLDFERVCFEDPHYGFAKFRVYDMIPFVRRGLIERYLDRAGITEREFAPRLAVRCLWTLQREIPPFDVTIRSWTEAIEVPGDGDDERYRRHVLRLLAQALNLLER